MKKVLFYIFSFAALLTLFSCRLNQNDSKIRVHLSARSKNGSEIEFKVYPENQYGMIANGAAVCVVDEANIVTALDFDNSEQCFTNMLESAGTKFRVQVKSVLSDDVVSMDIVHHKLTEKPVLSVLADSDGHSALSAENVDASKDIQTAWNSLGSGVVYTVSVITSSNTVWAASTNAQTITIPAGTLIAGKMYYLKVSAQVIDGDPYYISSDYYSVSEYSGSSVSFSTLK